MQLALIVQLSIAALAMELAGTLPLGGAAGLACALAAPLAVLAFGLLAARRAERLLDAHGAGVESFDRFAARAPWVATTLLLAAAMSAMPAQLGTVLGAVGVGVLLMACGIATTMAVSAAAWTIERRLREASLVASLDRARPVQAMPSRMRFVLAKLRSGVAPLLVPLLIPLGCSELARLLAEGRGSAEAVEFARLAGGVGGLFVLFLLVPFIVPPLLGLERLPQGELRDDLEELARGAGVHMRELWVWPTDGVVANAAVMGVFPRLRCVMLTDALLESMPRAQIRAVMAHELGHVVRRHLLWMVAVVIACWTVAGLVLTPLAREVFVSLLPRFEEGEWQSLADAVALVRDGAVLATGLCLFGLASRRFERQADTFAVQLLSRREASGTATEAAVDSMVAALGSVAYLNHVRPERPSWRHGSIAWRQAYLRAIAGSPLDAMRIDAIIAVVSWASLAVAVGALAWAFLPAAKP
ncbi:MAG: M48 family metalloprotease [Planctomycetaceae bacterium]|nr:M48 family metalloprotease [Planctomycetaceae bacterium]